MNSDFPLYGPSEGVEYFRDIMAEHPEVRFFHPNFDRAPWHVIAEVPGVDGITRRVHFWPHTMKCCPEDDGTGRTAGPAQIGADAMRQVIAASRIASDPADLFED